MPTNKNAGQVLTGTLELTRLCQEIVELHQKHGTVLTAHIEQMGDILAAAAQAQPEVPGKRYNAVGWIGSNGEFNKGCPGINVPPGWETLFTEDAAPTTGKREPLAPATAINIACSYGTGESLIHVPQDYVEGWRDSEKHHGITGEQR